MWLKAIEHIDSVKDKDTQTPAKCFTVSYQDFFQYLALLIPCVITSNLNTSFHTLKILRMSLPKASK